MSKVLIFFVLCAVVINRRHVRAQQDIMEQGKMVVIGALAKGKEILDHGVSVKSERQQSYDIFGLKFGTNNGEGTGFGDAAREKDLNSFEDDLVRRRKRSLDVLAALRAAGLLTNSNGGTNVNIVKINSVSNVNNYGPETTTESSRRRRRLIEKHYRPLFSALDEKMSYVSGDTELHKDKLFKSHTNGVSHLNHFEKVEGNEVDGPATRNKRSLPIHTGDDSQGPIKIEHLMPNDDQKLFGNPRIKRSLVLSNLENKVSYFTSDSEAKADGSMKTHTFTGSRDSKLSKISIEPESEDLRRAKRSPQQMDEGTVTTDLPPRNGTRPGPPGGDGGGPPSGRPRGPPPGCEGGGPRGGPRGGRGKGRGPPPPPSEENDEDQPNDAAQRKKRETAGDEDSNESNSSYYSDSSSSEEAPGQRRRKREINPKSGDDNLTGTDYSESTASSYYSDSSSSEYSDSTSEEDQTTESNNGEEDTRDELTANETDVQRTKRSPCKGSRSTTLPPDALERRKREAESQEDTVENGEKDVSWFTDVMNKFFRAVKKVADTAKQIFSGGKRDEDGEGHPDAERI